MVSVCMSLGNVNLSCYTPVHGRHDNKPTWLLGNHTYSSVFCMHWFALVSGNWVTAFHCSGEGHLTPLQILTTRCFPQGLFPLIAFPLLGSQWAFSPSQGTEDVINSIPICPFIWIWKDNQHYNMLILYKCKKLIQMLWTLSMYDAWNDMGGILGLFKM